MDEQGLYPGRGAGTCRLPAAMMAPAVAYDCASIGELLTRASGEGGQQCKECPFDAQGKVGAHQHWESKLVDGQ